LEEVFKGRAVELCLADGDHLFIVAESAARAYIVSKPFRRPAPSAPSEGPPQNHAHANTFETRGTAK
jgi:hypothetical protein